MENDGQERKRERKRKKDIGGRKERRERERLEKAGRHTFRGYNIHGNERLKVICFID